MKLPAPLDLDTLLAPLDPRQPAGVFDKEDDAYQGIDHEMVKLGSLQEATIDWPYVDEAAQHYLCSQCKHLRIAGHLLTARARTRSWRGWAEATGVLAGMVERYWETSYPKPGATGYLAKRRLVGQLLERLSDSLAALENTGYGEEFYKAGQAALDSLQRSAESAQLDVSTLTRLEALLRQKAEALRAPELADARQLDTPARPLQPSRTTTVGCLEAQRLNREHRHVEHLVKTATLRPTHRALGAARRASAATAATGARAGCHLVAGAQVELGRTSPSGKLDRPGSLESSRVGESACQFVPESIAHVLRAGLPDARTVSRAV